MNTIQGFVLVAKPAGINSTVCVSKVKRLVDCQIKVGHAGTLDSSATGLMIIAISRNATKLMDSFITLDKKYKATGKLGELTETFDTTGTLISSQEPPLITPAQISDALTSFGSSYEQIPPIFSALKHQGERISTLARHPERSAQVLNAIVAYKKRTVNLYDLALESYEAPFFSIHAHVSHGTYIRSLINDIGNRLGSCATTYTLERTQIGPFSLDNAVGLLDLAEGGNVIPYLIPVAEMEDRMKNYKSLSLV